MFKTQGTVLDEDTDYVILEVHCPVDDNHGIEPIPTFPHLWICEDCGMEFEVIDAI